MKHFKFRGGLRPSQFLEFILRILLSVYGAHLSIKKDRFVSFDQLVQMEGYLPAMLKSILIAFVVVSGIRWITIKLDKLFPWQGRGGERLLLQILIGIGACAGRISFGLFLVLSV